MARKIFATGKSYAVTASLTTSRFYANLVIFYRLNNP